MSRGVCVPHLKSWSDQYFPFRTILYGTVLDVLCTFTARPVSSPAPLSCPPPPLFRYPGVARSIESDVDNLMRLISVANVLPRGLYVDKAVKVHVCVWGGVAHSPSTTAGAL